VEALPQIHSWFFSHSIILRGLPLSAVTASQQYLPRRLLSTTALTDGVRSTNKTTGKQNAKTGSTHSILSVFSRLLLLCVFGVFSGDFVF